MAASCTATIKIMEILTGNKYHKAVAAAIGSAERQIKIVMFKWRETAPGSHGDIDSVNRTLRAALGRGRSVQAIVNDDATARYLKTLGAKVKRTRAKKLIHAKMIICDDAVAFVGSHNLTENAARANLEISLKLTEPEACAELSKVFDKWWENEVE